MRAATVIVGAIAVSSCLIALALVLSSGSTSTQPTDVRAGEAQAQPLEDAGSGSSSVSTPTQCGEEVTVEGASCGFGRNALEAYEVAGGEPAAITATDPESGEETSLECGGTAPTICHGEGGVLVYFAP